MIPSTIGAVRRISYPYDVCVALVSLAGLLAEHFDAGGRGCADTFGYRQSQHIVSGRMATIGRVDFRIGVQHKA